MLKQKITLKIKTEITEISDSCYLVTNAEGKLRQKKKMN